MVKFNEKTIAFEDVTSTAMRITKFTFIFLFVLNCHEYVNSVTLKGSRAQEGQFPWLIQFQTVVPCAAVLITPDWALTAAQCIEQKRHVRFRCCKATHFSKSLIILNISFHFKYINSLSNYLPLG